MRKIWKLHENNVKSEFSSYVNKYKQSTQEDASIQSYWDILKRDLLGLQIGIVDGQEAQLDIEKHGGSMMILVTMFMRRSGKEWKQQSKRSIYKQRKRPAGI